MSLIFTTAGDRVDCGSDASLDDLQTMTSIAWVWITTSPQSRIWDKSTGVAFEHVHNYNSTYLEHFYKRATLDQTVSALYADIPVMGATKGRGKWVFISFVSDPTTDANNKMYVGDLLSPVAEPAVYRTRQAGSGAFTADAANNLILGSRSDNGGPLGGKLAWVGLWNTQLSQVAIEEQRLWPHRTAGCVLLHHLGENGLGTQYDQSLSANNGTVTGSAVGDDPPLGRPSDEGFVLIRPAFNDSPIVTVW